MPRAPGLSAPPNDTGFPAQLFPGDDNLLPEDDNLLPQFRPTIYFDYNGVLNSGGKTFFEDAVYIYMLYAFLDLLNSTLVGELHPKIRLLSYAPSDNRIKATLKDLSDVRVTWMFDKIVFTKYRHRHERYASGAARARESSQSFPLVRAC